MAAIPEERRLLVGADLAGPERPASSGARRSPGAAAIDVLVANAAVMPQHPARGLGRRLGCGLGRGAAGQRARAGEPHARGGGPFRARGGGSSITLSSWAAQRGSAIAQLGGYAASKAAIKNLTQTIARNYARDGVLAYVVAPGIVRTRMSEISARPRGGHRGGQRGMLTLGEMVPPEEVARLIVFLASGECRHLTGATIDVNGATYIR